MAGSVGVAGDGVRIFLIALFIHSALYLILERCELGIRSLLVPDKKSCSALKSRSSRVSERKALHDGCTSRCRTAFRPPDGSHQIKGNPAFYRGIYSMRCPASHANVTLWGLCYNESNILVTWCGTRVTLFCASSSSTLTTYIHHFIGLDGWVQYKGSYVEF